MKNYRFSFVLSILSVFCNFSLSAQTDCIGESGQLNYYYWNDITGSYLSSLEANERYPFTPDGTILLSGLKTPFSFNDFYGGRIRGYIRPNVTGEYTFNVIGYNNIYFFLSTDTSPDNAEKICEVYATTSISHDSFPEQTSDTLHLVEDNYYYFELLMKSINGNDFANIYWKTPSHPDEWLIVEGANVNAYVCDTICASYGTPCDDENPNTVNDIEDGNCNCYGQPEAGSTCIGERGKFRVWYYEGIAGVLLEDLEASPDFPDNPNNGTVLTASFFDPLQGVEYGALVKSFIRIPESGEYQFQMYGNNETRLFWSEDSSHSPADLTEIAYLSAVSANTPDTSDFFTLQEGDYHYFEIINKGNGNGDYLSLKWRRTADEAFELIDTDLFYTFENCDDICVPDGLLCDDNDDATYLDQYENCECVGTPCDVPDCSNGINYIPFAACNQSDQHLNNELDSWLSCETKVNPNSDRPNGHWVQFDLQGEYLLHTSHVWNYNAENETGKGFKEVTIDYSLDGENWTTFGTYLWEEATGTTDYSGFEGPDFGGLPMRYLLISAQNNWNGDDCAGFSEWKMFVETCPDIVAAEILGATEVSTSAEEVYQITNASPGSTYNWNITGGTIVNDQGSEIIVLWNGVTPYQICVTETIESGCVGEETCQTIEITTAIEDLELRQSVTVYPNPTSDKFFIQAAENIEVFDVTVYDSFGKLVIYQSYQQVDMDGFAAGIYFVKIETSEGDVFRRISLL